LQAQSYDIFASHTTPCPNVFGKFSLYRLQITEFFSVAAHNGQQKFAQSKKYQ